MTNPWDKKPHYVWVPRGYYSDVKIKEDDVQMFLLEEMNPWLEKLQEEILTAWTKDENRLTKIIVERGKKLEAINGLVDWINLVDCSASKMDVLVQEIRKILEAEG